jgi:hypothetical protein
MRRLRKRGEKFEELCKATPKMKFRTYEGLLVNVGRIEMLSDFSQDVSRDGSFDVRYRHLVILFTDNKPLQGRYVGLHK